MPSEATRTDDEGTRHSQWCDQFRQLCEFKVQLGHCRVPSKYSANPKLGNWVLTQRITHRLDQEGNPGSMPAERIRALDAVGFDWGPNQTDSWSVRFQQLCEFKAQFGHCLVSRQYAANSTLGKWVNAQRRGYRLCQEGKPSPITAERIRELESIGFAWGSSQTDWSVRFQQLCEFKAQFGHCLVARQYAANPKLGKWVSTQRRCYRLCQEGKPSPITAERIRELESIGFDWGPSQTDSWSVRFQQLCEFKAQFGHCLVPQQYAANRKLWEWVNTQRRCYILYQEGKPSPMTTERIRELESIGFDWGSNQTDSWSVRFQQLSEFRAQFGHCLMPNKYSANPTLGQWVSTQRYNCRLHQEGKPSPITAERIRELESIGFDWRTSQTDPWSLRCQQLCEFKAQFGHCLVPRKYSANLTLGQWVSTQRYNCRLNKEGKPSPLTAERIRELESIGFDWGSSQTDWSVRFQQLCEFKAQFGHCLVSRQYAVNPKLGQWVNTQRRCYRLYQEGKPSPITAERIRELESIGFAWGSSQTDWSARFQHLCEFKAQFGHCLVSRQYAATSKLGKWVNTQRRCYRLYQEGKPSPITVERIRELESIGFDWGTSKTDRASI
jgi:hypothetical protein